MTEALLAVHRGTGVEPAASRAQATRVRTGALPESARREQCPNMGRHIHPLTTCAPPVRLGVTERWQHGQTSTAPWKPRLVGCPLLAVRAATEMVRSRTSATSSSSTLARHQAWQVRSGGRCGAEQRARRLLMKYEESCEKLAYARDGVPSTGSRRAHRSFEPRAEGDTQRPARRMVASRRIDA
jgi:hypothetical protein